MDVDAVLKDRAMTPIPDIVIEKGRHKGKTVYEALCYKRKKLTDILSSIDDIGGSAPHLTRELYEIDVTLRVLSEMYVSNYSI